MSIQRVENKRYDEITGYQLVFSSRLNAYNILRITETNQYFLNIFKYFEIPKEIKEDDTYFHKHICLDTEWWDNISYEHYSTSYYWYVLVELNDIVNPFETLYEGQMIKVLKTQYFYYIFRDFKKIRDL
jgi:hypothetical protein